MRRNRLVRRVGIVNGVLHVRFVGPGVTVQDRGRTGYLRYGLTAAGPMDWYAAAIANASIGNPCEAAAIEISLGGAIFTYEGPSTAVAIAGGQFLIKRNGTALPPWGLYTLQDGDELSFRAGLFGAWCYLAVPGGISTQPVLGSRATHTPSAMGGLEGRPLRNGDRFPITPSREEADFFIPDPDQCLERSGILPTVLGPQDDYFTCAAIDCFFHEPFRITGAADRMGYCLEGTKLEHRKGHDIVSDGIAKGAVQVPGSGQPIVLMADRQPTGGYPKIATLTKTGQAALAQMRPGESVRFQQTDLTSAVLAFRSGIERINNARKLLRPLKNHKVTTDRLLSSNLISGVVAARI